MGKRKKPRPKKAVEDAQPELPALEEKLEEKVTPSRSDVPVIEATFDVLDQHKAEALAIFLHERERPLVGVHSLLDWRLCGRLSRLLLRGDVTCAPDERVLVTTNGRIRAEKIFIFGLGNSASFDEALVGAVTAMREADVKDVTLVLPSGVDVNPDGYPAPLTAVWR